MSEEDKKRIRKLEDNNLVMQQKQDEILREVKSIKKDAITKSEMDLANELLVERTFKKVEKEFAKKSDVNNLERRFNGLNKAMMTIAIALTISAITYLFTQVIQM